MGGKNPFMGIAYVVVGGICIALGALFTVAHLIKPRCVNSHLLHFRHLLQGLTNAFSPRKLGDHTYLTWNNEQPSTASASGRDPRFAPSA